MNRMPQTNKNCGQLKRRLIALSFLFCFIIVSLLATIFIIMQANHDCIGKGCPVCEQIHNVQKLLDRIGKAAVIMFVVVVGSFTAITTWAKLNLLKVSPSTLISGKTRLNN